MWQKEAFGVARVVHWPATGTCDVSRLVAGAQNCTHRRPVAVPVLYGICLCSVPCMLIESWRGLALWSWTPDVRVFLSVCASWVVVPIQCAVSEQCLIQVFSAAARAAAPHGRI